MSLGLTRDSIANLRGLIHEDLDFDPNMNLATSGESDDDYNLYEDDVEQQQSFLPSFSASTVSEVVTSINSITDKPIAQSRVYAVDDMDEAEEEKKNDSLHDEIDPCPKSFLTDVHISAIPKQAPPSYSGFHPEYSSYQDYYVDPYAINYGDSVLGGKLQRRNLFCCLFPFLFKDNDNDAEVSNQYGHTSDVDDIKKTKERGTDGAPSAPLSRSNTTHEVVQNMDTTQSPPKSILRKVFLPDAPVSSMDCCTDANSEVLVKIPPKGILRKKYFPRANSGDAVREVDTDTTSKSRRSLFPTYDGPFRRSVSDDNDFGKRIGFNQMARVITVESRKDLSVMERSMIWWQPTDYDEFKKTGRIIARAMLQAGSEVWLQTSDAWGKKQSAKGRANSMTDDSEYDKALQRYGVKNEHLLDNKTSRNTDHGSKWWCRFGHSRRGLEHVASIEEGRQRQQNVKLAIQSVLDEQRRQHIMKNIDPKKLASVSMQFTSWARDLALAAGFADADAVRSSFDASARCRLYYLTKRINQSVQKPNSLDPPNAKFIISANKSIDASVLDANTSSSLLLKKDVARKVLSQESNLGCQPLEHQVKIFVEIRPHNDINAPEFDGFLQEEIHDRDDSHEKLSKIAAGYGAGRQLDALTGMVSIPTATRIGAH